jgi:hypothetical protein
MGASARDVEPLTYRIADLARALGVSRRLVERELAAGRLPAPDRRVGRLPLWQRQTIVAWLSGEGRRR